jgi:hypothetical protein
MAINIRASPIRDHREFHKLMIRTLIFLSLKLHDVA